MIVLESSGVRIGLTINDKIGEVFNGLKDIFGYRYIPEYSVEITEDNNEEIDALVKWNLGKGFEVKQAILRDNDIDEYIVVTNPPGPYVNESPYFFLLQVLSRSLAKKRYLVITDSISFYKNGKAYLLMGYPHSGKSTILSIAISDEAIPLSTENTIVEVRKDGLYIVNGTKILVYDPVIEEKYSVKLPYIGVTKHGYRIVDIKSLNNKYNKEYRVDEIYVLHCSFSSTGSDTEIIKGRKIRKILWHFAYSLIRGLDYYDPYPLSLSTKLIDKNVSEMISEIANQYREIYEIFGRPDHVYEYIVNKHRVIK
ncbi:MAG: hypothetical protein J7L82_02190 [Staphylothermus sp.]|nr:hypothetical protein [Staphylothermus sp.]